MKKIILTYGLIAGAIVSVMMFITMPLYSNHILNLDNGEVVGYTTMIVAFSMIFFAIKSHRDNHSNGAITFGRGVKIGLLITLIASFTYVVSWEICQVTVATDFMEHFEHYYLDEAIKNGSPEKLAEAKSQMEQMKEWYKNPVLRYGMTFMEIFPVGLVITLICAAVLRKKEFLPAK